MGTLHLADGRLQVNIHACSGTEPVRIDAELVEVLNSPHGWMRVQSDAIPLDEKLLVALPDGSQKVVRSLQPQGTIRVDYRIWRERPESPLQKHLVVELNRCALRFDKFPYPVRNIRGVIEMQDDRWQFRDLEGNNEAGKVYASGRLESRQEGRGSVSPCRRSTSRSKANCAMRSLPMSADSGKTFVHAASSISRRRYAISQKKDPERRHANPPAGEYDCHPPGPLSLPHGQAPGRNRLSGRTRFLRSPGSGTRRRPHWNGRRLRNPARRPLAAAPERAIRRSAPVRPGLGAGTSGKAEESAWPD